MASGADPAPRAGEKVPVRMNAKRTPTGNAAHVANLDGVLTGDDAVSGLG
jgi:hypothetical protein